MPASSMTEEPLLRAARSGVHLAPDSLEALRKAAQESGIVWREIAAEGARDKAALLAACARDLAFPQGFGANWDALSDCLRDLGWLGGRGWVLLWRGAGELAASDPEAHATALEVFRDAAHYWKERGVLFLVLLDRAPRGADVPPLPRP